MSFCRHCGQAVPAAASSCPACGGRQALPGGSAATKDGPLWPAITSLVMGIVSLLGFLESDGLQWDSDLFAGIAFFAGPSLALGVYSLRTHRAGRGLAIAGVVLSSLSGVLLAGMLI